MEFLVEMKSAFQEKRRSYVHEGLTRDEPMLNWFCAASGNPVAL